MAWLLELSKKKEDLHSLAQLGVKRLSVYNL